MSKKSSTQNGVVVCLRPCMLLSAAAISLMVVAACGGSGLFGDKSDPSAEPTVVPPVQVSGSYITSVLVDETNTPIAQADVSADGGRMAAQTDSAGFFKLPIAMMRENSFDLDVKRSGQEFPLRLKPCPHMLAAIKVASASEGLEASLVMAIRLSSSATIPPNDPSTGEKVRLLSDSISVPKETGRSVLRESPLLQFKLQAPLSGSTIQPEFVLSGECAIGHLVRVFGDTANVSEVTCTDVGGRGGFTVNATALNRTGTNSVVFEHVDPASRALVSQLVLLKATE